MEKDWTKLIDRYLNNELSEEGKYALEQELATNTDLKAELELQQLAQTIIARTATREMVNAVRKSYYVKKYFIFGFIALLLCSAAVISAIYLKKSSAESDTKTEQLNKELFQTKTSFTEAEFAQLDTITMATKEQQKVYIPFIEQLEQQKKFANIPSNYFKFTGESDAFMTSEGTLLSVAQNSFTLNGKPYNGSAVIQFQEATTAVQMAKAGLSTRADEKLLETQGMFSLQAFTPEGKLLTLSDKGVYVQVPVDEYKSGMKLFDGISLPNGDVNWVNPVELERLPQARKMTELDFYPGGYEAKLDELKWKKEKSQRDSLYLSFEFENSNSNSQSVAMNPSKVLSDTVRSPYASPIKKGQTSNGKELFEKNCKSCHHPTKEGSGPALKNVRIQWVQNAKDENIIYQWVRDWESAANKNSYAREVMKKSPTGMDKFPQLTNEQIDKIFDYVDSYIEPKSKRVNENFIPPSKVLAIWKPTFEGTNLSTVEFEERMQAIQQTCDKKLLELYVNNLDEALWKLDERAVKMGYPQFQKFADQRVGKLDISDDHQKNLQQFYEQTSAEIQEMGRERFQEKLNKQRAWDQEFRAAQTQDVIRKGIRESQNLNEEFEFNMDDVYKQLGKERPKVGFRMSNGRGVKNIDRYVMDAAIARQSTTITDPETQKTAQIIYNEFTFEVNNAKQYDQLYIYLFSQEMNSFQRLDIINGKLKYNLNAKMNYKAAVIGINKDQTAIYEIQDIKAENGKSVGLKAVADNEFTSIINRLNNERRTNVMKIDEELNWLFTLQKNYIELDHRKKDTAFRNQLRPIIFPCAVLESNFEIDSFK